MSRRFFVIGYCGRGNVGDDALAATLLDLLHREDPNSQFALLAPRHIQLEDGLQAKVFLVPQQVIALMKEGARATDVLVAGGTHFQDYGGSLRWAKVLTKYFLLFAWCKLLRKRITFLSIGVGSISTWWGRLLTRQICALANDISVREESSLKLLQHMGFANKTRLSFDLSGLFARRNAIPGPSKESGTILGISLLPSGRIYHNDAERDNRMADAIADAVNRLSQGRSDLSVHIFAFNSECLEGDVAITRYLDNRLQVPGGARIVEYENDPALFLHQVQKCHLFLSMRLHSILFAYLSGIPQISIPYHPKCQDVAQEIQLPKEAQISESEVLAGKLQGYLETLYEHPEYFCARLPVEEVQKRAMESFNTLVSRGSSN